MGAVIDLNDLFGFIEMIGGIDMAAVFKILAVGLSGRCTAIHGKLARLELRPKGLISRLFRLPAASYTSFA